MTSFLVSLLGNSVAAQADTVTLTVGAPTGQFTGHGQAFNLLPVGNLLAHPQDTYPLLSALKPKALRVGGNPADHLYWNRSTTPRYWTHDLSVLEGVKSTVQLRPQGGVLFTNNQSEAYHALSQSLRRGLINAGSRYTLAVTIDYEPPVRLAQTASAKFLLDMSYEDAAGNPGEASQIVQALSAQVLPGSYTTSFSPQVPAGSQVQQAHFSIAYTDGTGQIAIRRVSLTDQATGQEILMQGDFAGLDFPPLPYTDYLTADQVERFLALNRQLGSSPILTLNLGAYPFGDARDDENRARQVDLIRYFNVERGEPIPIVELGNEPELWFGRNFFAEHLLTEEWQQYAARARRYTMALRAVDPNIAVAAPVVWFGREAPYTAQAIWDQLLEFQPKLVPHFYPLANWRPTPCPVLPANALDPCSSLDALEQGLFGGPTSGEMRNNLMLTEYATTTDAQDRNGQAAPTTTQADALWTSRLLFELDGRGYSQAAKFLVGAASPLSLFDAGGGTIRPSYYAHYLLSQHWGHELLDLQIDPPRSVFAQASTDREGRIYVALVNPQGSVRTINVRLATGQRSLAQIFQLSAQDLGSTQSTINGVRIHDGDMDRFKRELDLHSTTKADFPLQVQVAAYSLTVLESASPRPYHRYLPTAKR